MPPSSPVVRLNHDNWVASGWEQIWSSNDFLFYAWTTFDMGAYEMDLKQLAISFLIKAQFNFWLIIWKI